MQDHLQSQQKWNSFLSQVNTSFDDLETNKERAKREISQILTESILSSLTDNTAVLLSGGIDSSLLTLLASKEKQITAITVGTENAEDVEWAEKVAKHYSVEWKYKILTLDDTESILKEVIDILNTTEMVTVSVGVVTYAASKIAAALKKDNLITGLGSEELFAGYKRHEDAFARGYDRVHACCMQGLTDMWERDLKRDLTLAQKNNVTINFPFLSKDMIKKAMAVHPIHKIDQSQDKIVVRELAKDVGLLEEVAYRKKRAAQYGSKVMTMIDKLAKKNGFSYKQDYLESLRE